MKRFQSSLVVASLIICAGLWPASAADVSDAQKAAMCQARKTCAIAPSLHKAGSSAAGTLSVAELHFGIADKPDDGPEEGCIGADYETRDGGVEYWLLEGAEPPRLLLRLCNDGYGAAGVGEDEVTVAENRFTHSQNGGSASRWEETTTESLSPLRLVNLRSCSFHSLIPGSGRLADIDPIARIVRSVTVRTDPAKAEDESDENGADVACPDWPEKVAFTPTPAEGLMAGYNLPVHNMAGDASSDLPSDGWALGNCGFAMATDGRNGFIVFGQPAVSTEAAEITALAVSDNELVLQVY
ncbi:MAG TPA: hypothetical protein VE914_09640, partial [Candidatus Angelobacter sp.]|nr:hypothetical protein [Candidatus Angelobacter sp.]